MRTTTIEARIPEDYVIDYWYSKDQELPDDEAEHIREMLEEGYVEGELNDSNINRGWWKLVEK
ncbi:MAG: hypothetical protein Q8O55_06620 [Dehalococcoidales bacterium]|nr:hypothetical protein [Dehalococcoidales bacterium]